MVCVFMEFCIHHHKQFWDFFFTPKRPLSCQSSILLLGIYVGAVKSFQNRKIKVGFSFLKDCLQTCNCPRPAMAHVCTHTHTQFCHHPHMHEDLQPQGPYSSLAADTQTFRSAHWVHPQASPGFLHQQETPQGT